MPMHDWTRVEPGIFHAFHHDWITELSRTLNRGLLPDEYYALAEQQAAGFGPDVLTLDSIAVRHVSGDRIVAMLEIVSPGNKSSRHGLQAFVAKACELLEHRVHLLILDPFPAGRRDPNGIHAAIWQEVEDAPIVLPKNNMSPFIQMWDLGRRKVVREWAANERNLVGLQFTPDGKSLVGSFFSGTICVWDPATGKERLRFKLDGELPFNGFNDGKPIVVVPYDFLKRAGSGDLAPAKNVGEFRSVLPYNALTKVSPDGKLLATADFQSSRVRFWDLASGQKVGEFSGNRGAVQAVDFSTNGALLAIAGADATVLIVEVRKVIH